MEESKIKGFKNFKIFIIVFLAIGIFFIKEDNRNKVLDFVQSGISREKLLVLSNSIEIDSEIESIKTYDNNMVLWKNNKLIFMNLNGVTTLEKDFNFEDPEVFFQDKNIYVADKLSGDIYVLDTQGTTLDRFRTEENLFSIKDFNHKVIYHRKSKDDDKIVVIDDSRINEFEHVYTDKSVLTYGMYSNKTDYAIALLTLNNNKINSGIDIYKSGEKSSEIIIENEIILKMIIATDDSIVVLTDNSIYFIKDEGILWNKKLGNMKDLQIRNNEIYTLYDNSMEVLTLDGTLKTKMNLSDEYKRLGFMDNSIVLYGSESLSIIKDGAVNFKSNESIKDVFVTKNEIFVWNENKLNFYKVKYK